MLLHAAKMAFRSAGYITSFFRCPSSVARLLIRVAPAVGPSGEYLGLVPTPGSSAPSRLRGTPVLPCLMAAERAIPTKHGAITLEQLAEMQPGMARLMDEYAQRFWTMYYAAKGGNWALAGDMHPGRRR